jgi:uncharacterized repeat protein (TIGR03803 family)
MTTASAPRTLYNFGAGEIAAPGTVAPLFQAADGDFYGVASQSSLGAFFRMSPSGNVVRIRWFFTGFPGQEDTGPIDTGFIQGGDGRFYGTNQDLRGGSVLRIDVEQDRVDRLKVFERGTASAASLVEGSDGSFYGSTVSSITNLGGGRFQIGGGTIFRITGTGVYSLLHTFPPVGTGEGRHPTGALIQGRDGNIYGTTKDGGRATTDFQGMGTVFRMTPEGALTTLHQFDVAEGIHPWAGLAEGEDGAFYGTTPNGGLGHGTVYRITATGEFSIVHTFTGVDGSEPYAPLTLASDGSLYGITPVGGTAGMGAIFRVTPAAALPDRLLGKAK